MANDDRTEKATPKHREESRKKGQVARSPDLGGSVVIVAGLLALSLIGPQVIAAGSSCFREMFAEIAHSGRATSAAGLKNLLEVTRSTITTAVAPVAGVCVAAALAVGVAQAGFKVTPAALKPDFKRINPVSGAKNLLGPNLPFEAFKAVAKISIVGGVAALALLPGLTQLAASVGMEPHALGGLMISRATGVAQKAAFAYLAIGALDFAWKRRKHVKELMMTKREVKDELRQYGVSAEVKQAQRRRQMQAARVRMMAAVPNADVVVTNPTHYAVALMYDGTRKAPEVVAKGKDLVALQIRRIAEENNVPVLADPPLARSLHGSTEIGQMIPEELYAAVAQVLAFVYRAAGRKRLAS